MNVTSGQFQEKLLYGRGVVGWLKHPRKQDLTRTHLLTEINLQVIKLYMCTSHKFCLLTVLSPQKKTTEAFWLDDSLQFLFWMGPKCSHFSELPLPNFSLDDSVWFQVGWNAAFCITILFNEAWMSVGYLLQADFWKWFSFFPLRFPLAKGGAVFVNTATCI